MGESMCVDHLCAGGDAFAQPVRRYRCVGFLPAVGEVVTARVDADKSPN